MDPDISIMFQSPSSRGLSEDRVRVELSPSVLIPSRCLSLDVLRLEENALLWSELCPSAKGAVKLYSLVQPV
ncbi:hypothetical protein EOD39_21098 [Acipenser ruthenus]|uniref:Uncharacterized protein n=1 Tax=Acipenser ruthenus TaxID=7906 RepID=A0A444UTL3_ACIRT|nr:hypothetical protein EOD39_21098 [Acipenser ruthenus]